MNDPRLERYLGSLEAALRPFPVGDRADIITEIRSHVLSALERDPSTRLDSVLAALGEPETVANRYLLERGLKTTKPPISPIVKWLVVGCLTAFAMMLIFCAFVFTWLFRDAKFENHRLTAWNGMINMDPSNNQFTIHGISKSDDFGGSVNVGDHVVLVFSTGKVEVKTSDDDNLKWACNGRGAPPNPKTVGAQTSLDFSALQRMNCTIEIPSKRHLDLKMDTGGLEFEEPKFNVKASVGTGKIEFNDASDVEYKFTTSVSTGKTDSFKSSEKSDALIAELHVGTGMIEHGD